LLALLEAHHILHVSRIRVKCTLINIFVLLKIGSDDICAVLRGSSSSGLKSLDDTDRQTGYVIPTSVSPHKVDN